jgi:hypothetical protein
VFVDGLQFTEAPELTDSSKQGQHHRLQKRLSGHVNRRIVEHMLQRRRVQPNGMEKRAFDELRSHCPVAQTTGCYTGNDGGVRIDQSHAPSQQAAEFIAAPFGDCGDGMPFVHRLLEQSQSLDIVIGETSAIGVGSLWANCLITHFPTPNQVRFQPCFRRNVFNGVGRLYVHGQIIKKPIANVNIMFNICFINI